MNKPRDLFLSTDNDWDYDIAERVTRQLQESALHVFFAYCVSSLPEPLLTGSPEDELSGIFVDLTFVTDGRRGFLVLARETQEYDVVREFTELVDSYDPGSAARGDFVLRGAELYPGHPMGPTTLDLRDRARVRAVLEEAYEVAFAGAPPIDHEVLLSAMRKCGCLVKDEAELRADYDS